MNLLSEGKCVELSIDINLPDLGDADFLKSNQSWTSLTQVTKP